ncbi:MAG: hypothetical protein LKJ90_08965 [Faecalibacterium sp.]|jgi:hypothetical protein|nr:hypothetical protein [Faecalibacterium sp.]
MTESQRKCIKIDEAFAELAECTEQLRDLAQMMNRMYFDTVKAPDDFSLDYGNMATLARAIEHYADDAAPRLEQVRALALNGGNEV